MLLKPDEAVNDQRVSYREVIMTHQEGIEVSHRVVSLRPNPDRVEIGEVEAALGRMVAGGEGPTHRHRIHGVDVLADDEDFRRKVSVVGSPQRFAELLHELLKPPAGDLVPVVLNIDYKPAHPRLERDQALFDREPFPLQVGDDVGTGKKRDRDLRTVRSHTQASPTARWDHSGRSRR